MRQGVCRLVTVFVALMTACAPHAYRVCQCICVEYLSGSMYSNESMCIAMRSMYVTLIINANGL